jgi:nicotinate-nucleotide--dimethylbenzimidazole phosphoribosyltransferase
MLIDFDVLPGPDMEAGDRVLNRAANVLRPNGALERLDSIAVWLAQWQRTEQPKVERPAVLVFVADHGVAAEDVSAYPAEVTRAMFEALNAGVATAAVMARHLNAALQVLDVGVGVPTGNIRFEPAMDESGFEKAFSVGRDAVEDLDADVLILGEMGIGNTTAAAAVAASLTGNPVAEMVGRGTGLDHVGQAHKRRVVQDALDRAGHVGPMILFASSAASSWLPWLVRHMRRAGCQSQSFSMDMSSRQQ